MKSIQELQAIYEAADCLHDWRAIDRALDQMAMAITQELKEENPLLLCVMVGALIPVGHLVTRLHFPLEVDYIHATRYNGKMQGEELHWLAEPRVSLQGRTVLIVDDILDQGLTLAALIDYCKKAGAKRVLTAVMVNKQCARAVGGDIHPDYIGLETENRYLFGFGLDYENALRHLPGIYAVKS